MNGHSEAQVSPVCFLEDAAPSEKEGGSLVQGPGSGSNDQKSKKIVVQII